MTDFQSEVEKAIFDRLVAQVTGAQVFQHVPDNTPPPVVIVSDVLVDDEADKDSPLFRFDIQILCVVAVPGRKSLNALQAQVREALNDWKPAATALALFGEVKVNTSSGQEIQAPQGPVYYGQQSAVVYVQAP